MARASNPRGTAATWVCDRLDELFTDDDFADWYPIGVEYSLTLLGESFRGPFTRLHEWTIEHSDEVLSAQHEYDARSSGL